MCSDKRLMLRATAAVVAVVCAQCCMQAHLGVGYARKRRAVVDAGRCVDVGVRHCAAKLWCCAMGEQASGSLPAVVARVRRRSPGRCR